MQDVTRQREAEKDLRQSEQRFRLLVDAVEDYAIFMLDPTGHVTTWNAGAQRIKGYTAEEIIGQHFRVFYPLERQAEGHPERELERALEAGRYAEEGWRIRKGGTRFWANVTITAVYDEDGTHVGFAKVTRDVTERRRADEALRRSEQRFRLLVDTVEDYAIFMLDPTGHVTTWNAGAQRSKGYTADEIIGQHFRVFYPPERQAEGHPEHELERALQEGHYQEEGWRVRKDGTRFWADVTITAVHDDDGTHVGFAKVTRDTTAQFLQRQDKERAAATLAAAYEQLDAAHVDLARTAEDQAKLLSRTAHELRSPVGVLAMSAELLRQHGDEMPADDRDRVLAGMSVNVQPAPAGAGRPGHRLRAPGENSRAAASGDPAAGGARRPGRHRTGEGARARGRGRGGAGAAGARGPGAAVPDRGEPAAQRRATRGTTRAPPGSRRGRPGQDRRCATRVPVWRRRSDRASSSGS